jgi:hypothetical protein
MKKQRVAEKMHKSRMDLLPGKSLLAVGRVLGYGAGKHGAQSWKKYPKEAYLGAVGRHWADLLEGIEVDEETGESHWAHIAASALFMLWIHEEGSR